MVGRSVHSYLSLAPAQLSAESNVRTWVTAIQCMGHLGAGEIVKNKR